MIASEDELLALQDKALLARSQALLNICLILDSTVNHLLAIRSELNQLPTEPLIDPLNPTKEYRKTEIVTSKAVQSLLGVCVALRQTGHVMPLMDAWQTFEQAIYDLRVIQQDLHAVSVSDLTRDPIEQSIHSPEYLDAEDSTYYSWPQYDEEQT